MQSDPADHPSDVTTPSPTPAPMCSFCRQRPSVCSRYVSKGLYLTTKRQTNGYPRKICNAGFAVCRVHACAGCIGPHLRKALAAEIRESGFWLLLTILGPFISVGMIYATTEFANMYVGKTMARSGDFMTLVFVVATFAVIFASAFGLFRSPYTIWKFAAAVFNWRHRDRSWNDIDDRDMARTFKMLAEGSVAVSNPQPLEQFVATVRNRGPLGEQIQIAGAGDSLIQAIPLEWVNAARASLGGRFPVQAAMERLADRMRRCARYVEILIIVFALIVAAALRVAAHNSYPMLDAMKWCSIPIGILFFWAEYVWGGAMLDVKSHSTLLSPSDKAKSIRPARWAAIASRLLVLAWFIGFAVYAVMVLFM